MEIYRLVAKELYPDEIGVTENKITFKFGEEIIHLSYIRCSRLLED